MEKKIKIKTKIPNCKHGFQGSCCCNCLHQRTLKCHPYNKGFGEGSITKTCGYTCNSVFGDGSNYGTAVFMSGKHGMCELWFSKKEYQNQQNKKIINGK